MIRNIDEKTVYPAAYDLPNIISVTSVNNDGGLSYFSDYGENNVGIATIGKDIESTLPNNDRGMESGTSMSAAVFSRGLSILYATNKCSSPKEYKDLIVKTSDKVSSLTNYVGNSAKLNIENALNGVIKSEIETIDYNDEFSISSEVYDESTSYRLFAASKTIDIKAGMYHTIALKEDGSVWAWGKNDYGQLGNGTNENSSIPVQVQIDEEVTTMSAGYEHSLLVTADKSVYGWGRNNCCH